VDDWRAFAKQGSNYPTPAVHHDNRSPWLSRSVIVGTRAGKEWPRARNARAASPDSRAPPFDGVQTREIAVYTTADKTDCRLFATDNRAFKPMGQRLETQICVFVDPAKRFQTIRGLGGALTDASAETFAKLPPTKHREILDAYFDPNKGIGYTLGRTHIHSCDFSSAGYTWVREGDAALQSFSVDHDRQFRIPFTKQVLATAGGKLTLFASPWSPPALMKTNNDMLHGGN